MVISIGAGSFIRSNLRLVDVRLVDGRLVDVRLVDGGLVDVRLVDIRYKKPSIG
jgi:hypothetical protein